jgi:PAS domain S-box-containing protein
MPMLAGYTALETLREDEYFVLFRARRLSSGSRVLVKTAVVPRVAATSVERLEHEFALRGTLDPAWALPPTEMTPLDGRPSLVFADPGGDTLEQILKRPLDLTSRLRIAVGLAAALGNVHAHGLIHKDIKPANVLVDMGAAEVRLSNFGIASELLREPQEAAAAEVIAGTLAYMAPEQTGRMNRSVDSRSDLYSLGVTFYEMFCGVLPFSAEDPLEWVHCHIARQPLPAQERAPELPVAIANIVMKLLAKTAEDRYQTARAVVADLTRCLAEWTAHGSVEAFPLGAHDASGELFIAEKLYGREQEIRTLWDAFRRVEQSGVPELLLVSGYAGIGKSALVNELHKVMPARGSLFASGKFDQYKRDIPYATFAQALQDLVQQLLPKKPADVAAFSRDVLDAVGPNGQLVLDLIPELRAVIGEQPPLPELAPREAQNRFQTVFRQFVGALATREHPLVLFLDDLQWLDAASLELFEYIAGHPDVRYLLLIGAYRDNEVNASHPLALALEGLRKRGLAVREIVLEPLSLADVQRLIADTVRADVTRVAPLAELVHEKTAGNPFFTIQFLRALLEERLLEFDAREGEWSWDIERIRARNVTDNVVDLMVGKLRRFSPATQNALKALACLGSSASSLALARVLGQTEEQTTLDLHEAMQAGLLIRARGAYSFLHDRIHEAAYTLVPRERRPEEHLRIARLLLSLESGGEPTDAVFDLAAHFNRALELLSDERERELVRDLNFRAGLKAKTATAHAAARVYLNQALALQREDAWQLDYPRTFRLLLELAECEYLVGDFESAQAMSAALLDRAASDLDRAEVFRLRTRMSLLAGRYREALAAGFAGLELFSITVPASEEETRAAVLREHAAVQAAVNGRSMADLTAPVTTDPATRTVLGLIADLAPLTYITRSAAFPLLILKGVSLSLRNGTAPESAYAFVNYGMLLVALFDDVEGAYAFSELGLRLNESFADAKLRGMLLLTHAYGVNHWRKHFAQSAALIEQATIAALTVGDFVVAGYAAMLVPWFAFEKGETLAEGLRQADRYAALALQIGNRPTYQMIRLERQFMACLSGATRGLTSFSSDDFDEDACLAELAATGFSSGLAYHVNQKLAAAFLHERYEEALGFAQRAEASLTEVMASSFVASHGFYHALTLAALSTDAGPEQRREYGVELAQRALSLQHWAERCPENYAHRHLLVRAELARIEGREEEAARDYEAAIAAAREQGFVHQEALAHELAARFHEARGFATTAHVHYRSARAGYARWGALAKVKLIDQRHPPADLQAPLGGVTTIRAPLERLDLLTVIKASQALSEEIVLSKLIERLLGITVEHAGAQRGVLLLMKEDEWLVEAEASTERQGVEVLLHQTPVSPTLLPESILRFLERTHESVILDDACAANPYSDDEYLRRGAARSVMCVPLLKQASMLGALYLENNLTPRAFTPDHVAVLEILASQAAISLLNARLYERLQREDRERRRAEERFTKAFDESPTPMAITRLRDDGFVDANAKFLATFDLRREEVLGRSAIQLGITDPEQVERARALIDERGSFQEVEFTARNRAGQPRTLLVSIASIELEGEACSLITYLDMTERKMVEAQLRQSQKMEAIGRLAGGVAHDFNNLLTVISGYGTLALGDVDPGDPLHEPLREMVSAAEKAAALTRQLLAHSRQQALEPKLWNLNVVVSDMERMLHRIIGEDVRLMTDLDPSLPRLLIDRGQIEQVILNLVVNARDAMPEGGKLQLTTRSLPQQRAVMLSVSDTGMGMTEGVRARIFEPFYTTKAVGKGTGLGLATVYGVVQQSGGTIAVETEVGRGSCFRLTFPETASSDSREPRGSVVREAAGGSESILLVEDDASLRSFAARILGAAGYSVMAAANGREAMALLSSSKPSLVVSDIVMPDVGGRKLGQSIAELRPDLPILFMSGYAEPGLDQGGGLRYFLQKPFKPAELTTAVRQILDARRSRAP